MLVKEKKLLHIKVRGVVQGVGFRPFVYRLAQQYGVKGWVRNTSSGVEIEAEGGEGATAGFLRDLKEQAPPMAHIENLEAAVYPPKNYNTFQILHSLAEEASYQLVSPDIATCADCQKEIFSADNRRFRYPFTNCTNCGPRFTIIQDIPYDRPNTTMKKFTMCPQCQAEYDDPSDRRFHAQPNACPRCGPSLQLVDSNGSIIVCDDVIKMSTRLLREGKILAIKGLGGFQLACDATSRQAVNLLRKRKRRPSKPLAVMFADIPDVEKECSVSAEERKLLQSPQCPIMLVKWQHQSSRICTEVAPSLKYLGVMLPYTPLHHLILNEAGLPLVMTSGNLSEEPIAKDNDEALRRLDGIADYFLLHNRDIYARYDDSVYTVEDKKPRAVRRARGYAPYPIFLPFRSRQALACGAQEKNTFCLTRDEHAFISQHIGDMENEETLEHFENTIELYKKLFRIQPEIIACDMHPEYLATKYARRVGESNLKLVPVQHHHAHIVSCMAENGITEPVIGVAFDGTGYGTDGTIWGGEFLLADYKDFRRLGHLEYVPMPGGESAIRKPYRMALGYLFTLLGDDFSLAGLPFEKITAGETGIIRQELRKKLNSPLTSSAGRLFDAVSALAGVRQVIDYDAQAAVEMEMQAPDVYDKLDMEPYPFSIASGEFVIPAKLVPYPDTGAGIQGRKGGLDSRVKPENDIIRPPPNNQGIKVVKLRELILAVVKDVREKRHAAEIALRFHITMAQVISEMCKLLSEEMGIKQVALSGGVFQNRLLTRLATSAMMESGLRVISHQLVPCNDGGISLGQAVVANYQ